MLFTASLHKTHLCNPKRQSQHHMGQYSWRTTFQVSVEHIRLAGYHETPTSYPSHFLNLLSLDPFWFQCDVMWSCFKVPLLWISHYHRLCPWTESRCEASDNLKLLLLGKEIKCTNTFSESAFYSFECVMERIAELHSNSTMSFFGFVGWLWVCLWFYFLKDHCTIFHSTYTFYHLTNNARAPIYAHLWLVYFLNECNMSLCGFDSYFHSGNAGYHLC